MVQRIVRDKSCKGSGSFATLVHTPSLGNITGCAVRCESRNAIRSTMHGGRVSQSSGSSFNQKRINAPSIMAFLMNHEHRHVMMPNSASSHRS
jgi:hypothetical protein